MLLFQPLFRVTAGTKTLVGFEALLRWQHPNLGCLVADQFISQAEKSGLVIPLGEWVLARALREGRDLQQILPHQEMRIAVNISPLHLPQAGFCAGLDGALEAEAFPPGLLSLEVATAF